MRMTTGVKCGRKTLTSLTRYYAGTLVKTIPWWKQFAPMVMRCRGTHRFGETHSQVGLSVPAESVLCGIWSFQIKHKVQNNDTDTQNLYGHRVGAGFSVNSTGKVCPEPFPFPARQHLTLSVTFNPFTCWLIITNALTAFLLT